MYFFCGYQIFAPETKFDQWETAAVEDGRYSSFEEAKEATAFAVRAELASYEEEKAGHEQTERATYKRLHKKYGRKK